MDIQKRLFELQDCKYAEFQSALIPNIARDTVIGVRIPLLRKLAKEIAKSPDGMRSIKDFMLRIPHDYYEEDLLHCLFVSQIKDYKECLVRVNEFLPYITNWAVCDIFQPAVFKTHHTQLINEIPVWIASEKPYTCRFGMEQLMLHFLDKDFKPEYLELPAAVRSEEYYVNMMTAWFFATALAKQWDASIPYLEQHKLDRWTHNKTIQKGIESYRITNEQKEYLRSLKRYAKNEN